MSDENTSENARQLQQPSTAASSPLDELHEDEIVTQLIRDGGSPTGLIVMFGYLAKTAEEGRWRLYRNLALSEWVEFLQSDVLYHQQFPPPGGGTRVWLKPNALMAHGRISGSEQLAAFLRGDIVANISMQPTLPSEAETAPDESPSTLPDCPRTMAGCHAPSRSAAESDQDASTIFCRR